MNPISMKVLSIEELQIGKKYVVLYQYKARIAEVLNDGTAHMEVSGFKIKRGICSLHFLMELPEEKQQSIFDNPYYEVEAARLQGKTIQLKGYGGEWGDTQSVPSYYFPPEDYRIKPETKTVYRCRYEYEDIYGQSEVCIWTSESALHADAIKTLYGGSAKFKKWIIEPECTPIEVEVK